MDTLGLETGQGAGQDYISLFVLLHTGRMLTPELELYQSKRKNLGIDEGVEMKFTDQAIDESAMD